MKAYYKIEGEKVTRFYLETYDKLNDIDLTGYTELDVIIDTNSPNPDYPAQPDSLIFDAGVLRLKTAEELFTDQIPNKKAELKQAYKQYEDEKFDAGWQRAMNAIIIDSLMNPTDTAKATRAQKAKEMLLWVDKEDGHGNIGLWGNYYLQKQQLYSGVDVVPNPAIMGEPPYKPSEV